MKLVLAVATLAAITVLAPPRLRAEEPDDDAPASRTARVAAELAADPPVADVRKAAVRYAGIDPARSRAWARRARLSGLLPQVTARATRVAQRDRELDVTDGTEHELGVDTGQELVLELRATWDLARLVFDPAEIRASREGARLAQERQNLESEVTRLYYLRRRARIDLLLDPPVDPVEAARRAVEMEEMTANLDALTGGWFSREIAKREGGGP